MLRRFGESEVAQYNRRRSSGGEDRKSEKAGWKRAEVIARDNRALRARKEELEEELEKEKKKKPPPPPPAKKAKRAAGHQATAATLVMAFYAIQEEGGWPIASEQFLSSEPVNTGLMALMSVILGTIMGRQ